MLKEVSKELGPENLHELNDKEISLVWNYLHTVKKFQTYICGRSAIIDPDDELCWYSLSIGFFINEIGATEETIPDILELAIIIRYELHYWC